MIHTDFWVFPHKTEEDFTAIRTSGEHESGWKMGNVRGNTSAATKHMDVDDVWRVYLITTSKLLTGWRRVSTFYPTKFKGDDAAIKAWQEDLEKSLEALEVLRLQNAE